MSSGPEKTGDQESAGSLSKRFATKGPAEIQAMLAELGANNIVGTPFSLAQAFGVHPIHILESARQKPEIIDAMPEDVNKRAMRDYITLANAYERIDKSELPIPVEIFAVRAHMNPHDVRELMRVWDLDKIYKIGIGEKKDYVKIDPRLVRKYPGS